jgi:hypothetical protein
MLDSPYLTVAGRKFLEALQRSEDGYAIQEGLEVWIDYQRFSPATVIKLLCFCLIKYDGSDFGAKIRRYVITQDGTDLLLNSCHVPRVVTALSERKSGS